jgi:hypothetical protein
MLNILPTQVDSDGFIIGLDYDKLNTPSDADIYNIDEHWQNNIEFNHTDPAVNELVPYLYDETDYTENSDGTFTVDEDAQVLTREEVEAMVSNTSDLWNEGFEFVCVRGMCQWGNRPGVEAEEAREKVASIKASLDSHATKYESDKGKDHQRMFYENDDGQRQYNFLRDGKYKQIIQEQNGEGGLLEKKDGRYVGYDYDDPENPKTEAEWVLEKEKEIEEMAKLSLRQDYEDLIEEKGGTMSNDELNQLVKKGYMDEYMAYILHKYDEARHATDEGGSPLFKDDFDFLNSQLLALEHYSNSASTVYHGDEPWREAAAKQLREGMLADLIGSGFAMIEGDNETEYKSIDALAAGLAKKYKKMAHRKGFLGIFGGRKDVMYDFIKAALLNTDESSGLRVNGVIPLEGGAFDCLLDFDAKSLGLEGDEAKQFNKWIKSKEFREVMRFTVQGSEEMKDIFKDSTQIMDVMRTGQMGDYTGKKGDYLPLGNNAGFVTQAYFVFNPKSRLYEPVIEFLDSNGEVVMEANGMAQYDQMIKAQMNKLMNRPSSLNRLAGSDTKGKVE